MSLSNSSEPIDPNAYAPDDGFPSVDALREAIRTLHRDLGRIVAPDGIDETRHVMLGGFPQFIALRGQSREAPILLFLHGGPGSPISDIAYAYQRPWEDFFLVVNWDQRGFGRSYGETSDTARLAGSLNRERYMADAVELMTMLASEFDQSKIVLVGQSWGTVMALEIARRRPDLLHVVVTQGLAANWLASPERHRQHLIGLADEAGDGAEADRLRALGPPPVAQGVESVMEWGAGLGRGFPDCNVWHNLRGGDDGFRRRADLLRYVSPDLPPDQYAREKELMLEAERTFRPRYVEAMASVLPWDAETDVGVRFHVPIVVMMGAHDWQTATDLARVYFDKISAPWKKWVEFPHAAHVLNLEQPGLSVVSLVNDALPAVRGEIPVGAIVQ